MSGKEAYEKGIRRSYQEFKENCNRHTMWNEEHKCKCYFRDNNNVELYPCDVKTCPIAEKLLKAVK